MAENFIANIKSKLGELRKEYLPSQKETKEKEEKMRLDEERKVRDEEDRKRQEEEKEMQRYCARIEAKYSAEIKREAREKQKKEKWEKKMCEEEKREEERIKSEKERWFSQMKEGASVRNLKVFNQKQLAIEKLSILKKNYVRLIQQKEELSERRYKIKYELTCELKRLKKKNYPWKGFDHILESQAIERSIEGVQTKIRELPIESRKSEKQLNEEIKIAESKIEQLNNDLSSDKFMTDQEIKKKLIKEEKGKLRIDRLRGEARKELFEKEFQAIPEDEKIRFISDEVKEFVWRRDQAKCVKCGSQDSLEFDHIIPFSKGGSNTARNIQLLCEKCNRSKHDNI